MRTPGVEEMILEKNVFVERSSRQRAARPDRGGDGRPTDVPTSSPRVAAADPDLPRQIPLDGELRRVAIVEGYARWLAGSDLPKLFINADPGVILVGAQRESCRACQTSERSR